MATAATSTIVPTSALILSVYAGMVLFAMPVTVSPILIAELGKQYTLSSAFGGVMVASQFIGMILGGLLVSRIGHRVDLARLAVLCVLCSAAIELASTLVLDSPELFLAARLAIGMGVGAVYTAVLSIAGINGNAEKVFGISTALCMATLAAITALAGYIYPSFGVRPGIALIALVTLLFSPLLLNIPSRPATSDRGGRSSAALPHLALGLSMGVGFLLGKMVLGLGGAFVIVAANANGISTPVASAVLGFALFTGMGGSALSAMIASRISRIRGAIVGLSGAATGWLLLYGSDSAATTYIAMLIYPFFSAFYATFLLGTANALDAQGRWAALVSPFTAAGMAIGAPIGGYIIRDFTLPHIAVAIVAILFTCAMIFIFVEARIARMKILQQ